MVSGNIYKIIDKFPSDKKDKDIIEDEMAAKSFTHSIIKEKNILNNMVLPYQTNNMVTDRENHFIKIKNESNIRYISMVETLRPR